MITQKIDFNKYESTYRIYNYYISLIALFMIYSRELFIKTNKKIVELDAKSIILSPSMDFELESIRSSLIEAESRKRGQSILQSVMQTISPPRQPKVSKTYMVNRPQEITQAVQINPNKKIDCVIKIFPDFKPCKQNKNKYFSEIKINTNSKKIDRLTDSICAIVPFYNEKAGEIHATLRSLYFNFKYIKKKDSRYKFTHFNVLLVGDGWFKADISAKRYLAKLYNYCTETDDNFESFYEQKHKHNTIILQTKFNKKLCINPFRNNEDKLFLKVTTIIKIDNRKKANSHEWFLGKYGFAEWCKCHYMFFTDAYSTMNKEGMYAMLMHMKQAKNQDVVCCTGRARVYTIEQELYLKNLLREIHDDEIQNFEENNEKKEELNLKQNDEKNNEEIVRNDTAVVIEDENKYDDIDESFYKWWTNDILKSLDDNSDIMDGDSGGVDVFYKIQDIEFDHRLTINAHLRACQMFEFEALYGTIGCYLLGGFLPVIPGPCGFYRSKYLLMNEVRGWYFEKINQKNDPNNINLVLGNMKLAEDRILTISSILNCEFPVRHSLIPECIFYFDPIPNLTQLMKQRRRWLNGSIATVIFVLRKISFSHWNVNLFRRYYVLLSWYMQLLMYIVVALSPPLIFTISFKYGLAKILEAVMVGYDDDTKEKKVNAIVITFMSIAWIIYLTFIYFVQGQKRIRFITKETIVQITLTLSYMFGLLTLVGTLIQVIDVLRPAKSSHKTGAVAKFLNYAVIVIYLIFFMQSFVLAPLVSKDFKTITILLKNCFHYFLYAPFYVTFFFINAIANIDDLSWGTRPDNVKEESQNDNPKATTIKVLVIVVFVDIIIGIGVEPFTQQIYAHVIFFSILALPSLYQIFFSVLWLIKRRLFYDLWNVCKPTKMSDKIEYTNLTNYKPPKVHHGYVELADNQ